MASKKKLPHSRRCKNPERAASYCYCDVDTDDCYELSDRKSCCSGKDYPDRVRSVSETSDRVQQPKYLPSRPSDDRLHRNLPPHENHTETNKQHVGPTFNCLDVLIGFSSVAFFYFDIVTDILLARDYFKASNLLAFGVTSAFVVIPSIVTCLLNFRWYLLDYQSQQILLKQYGKSHVQLTSRLLWFIRFCMTLMMMGPVVRQIEYIYNGVKSNNKQLSQKERKRHYQVMRMEDVDACCIRMFECFLEAAPQLVLQLYIAIITTREENWVTETIRCAAIVSSWGSLAWSMVSYQKALRFSHEDKENMTIPGLIFSFLWRAFEIGPRVIALALFATYFSYGVFIVIGLHWMLMSIWLFCQRTQFYQNRCEEKCFNIVCGYVLVFCFLNVRDGRTRYRMLLFYFIINVENWTMMGFWFYFTDEKSAWYYIPCFFTIVLSVFFQLFFQLTYYGCFHPLGRGKIPCCPESGEYTCFQSLCHELDDPNDTYFAANGQTPAAV